MYTYCSSRAYVPNNLPPISDGDESEPNADLPTTPSKGSGDDVFGGVYLGGAPISVSFKQPTVKYHPVSEGNDTGYPDSSEENHLPPRMRRLKAANPVNDTIAPARSRIRENHVPVKSAVTMPSSSDEACSSFSEQGKGADILLIPAVGHYSTLLPLLLN